MDSAKTCSYLCNLPTCQLVWTPVWYYMARFPVLWAGLVWYYGPIPCVVGQLGWSGTMALFPVLWASWVGLVLWPWSLCCGPAGLVWYYGPGPCVVGQLGWSGTMALFPVFWASWVGLVLWPWSLCCGPAGLVWYYGPGPCVVGQLGWSGTMALFPVLWARCGLAMMTAGVCTPEIIWVTFLTHLTR